MKLKWIFLLPLLLFLTWSLIANAQGGENNAPGLLILNDEQHKYALGTYIAVLEDASGELTIEDVTSAEYETQFVSSEDEVPVYGFTDSVYWVRLLLRNQSQKVTRWLLEVVFANTHFVDLFVPLGEGLGFEQKQSGALRPPHSRDVRHPEIIFDVLIPPNIEQSFYLRFQSEGSMTLGLNLWEPIAFVNSAQIEHLQHGIFFGVMAGLLAYNLFLFFSLKDINYLFLSVFLGSFISFEAGYSGYFEVYIAPSLYYLKTYYVPISFIIVFISAVLFSDHFLELKTRLFRLHQVNLGIIAGWLVLIFLSPFTSYLTLAQMVIPWGLVSLTAVLLDGIFSLRGEYRPARYFLFAWLGLLFTLSLTMLVRVGVFSSTVATENAYQFGIMWMAISWSIALADRINLLKDEVLESNRDLVHSKDRLAQILEGLPLGVVVYGNDNKPNFINRRVIEILSNPSQGIGPDISVGRTLAQTMDYFSFKFSGSDDPYPIENMPVQRALEGQPASADDLEADLVDRRVPLEVWASPVFGDLGEVESAVVAFQDISSRKDREAELDDYRRHLERLVQERTEELKVINGRLVEEVTERRDLEEFLNKRIQWMSALSLERQKISGSADMADAFDSLSATIRELFDAAAVFINHWDERVEPNFICRVSSEKLPPGADLMKTALAENSSLRREIVKGQVLIYPANNLDLFPAALLNCFQDMTVTSVLLSPMSSGSTISGVLGLALKEADGQITPEHVELASKMAVDLLNLTQYAFFLDQSRALLAAEQRNHLARDLHDSVTQVLFSASLVAEVLPKIIRRDPDLAMQSLEELRSLTRGALAEMRTLLLELRPSAVAKSPLHELLAQLTEASTTRSELHFQLFIEQTPLLPPPVHVAFYRIAQESLNNVAKHAQASVVTLSLKSNPQAAESGKGKHIEITLVVEDNGVGFSLEEDQVEHLGLGIMRERAADIQADLQIGSQIGQGTRVTLTWCGA